MSISQPSKLLLLWLLLLLLSAGLSLNANLKAERTSENKGNSQDSMTFIQIAFYMQNYHAAEAQH